jgi:non-specific serine/threonine protein kinase
VAIGEEAVSILRSTGNLRELCNALGAKAFAATFAGQWEVARVAAEEAVELAKKHYHPLGYFQSLTTLILEAAFSGDFAKSAAYLEEQRKVGKQLNNPWVDAQTAHMEGRFFRFQGDLPQAQAAFERASQRFSALKDHSFARITKSEVSHLMRQQGDLAGALPIYRETILGILEVGNLGGVAHQLECFGYIAIALEEPERAAKLLGAARALREQAHAESVFPWEKADLVQAMAQLTEMLREPARDAAMAEGRQMSVDEAVAFALGEVP